MASTPAAAAAAEGGGEKGRAAKAAEMKVAMEEVARKLALWHTRTFRPILTHDDLDPILAAEGFVALPAPPPTAAPAAAVAWREYAFRGPVAGLGWMPRPRLPYPRVDGLHLMTYQAFLAAVEFYLGPHRVPNLFHVRSPDIPNCTPHALSDTAKWAAWTRQCRPSHHKPRSSMTN